MIRRALEKGKKIRTLSIRQIMNPKPTTVYPQTMAARAAQIMENRRTPPSTSFPSSTITAARSA